MGVAARSSSLPFWHLALRTPGVVARATSQKAYLHESSCGLHNGACVTPRELPEAMRLCNRLADAQRLARRRFSKWRRRCEPACPRWNAALRMAVQCAGAALEQRSAEGPQTTHCRSSNRVQGVHPVQGRCFESPRVVCVYNHNSECNAACNVCCRVGRLTRCPAAARVRAIAA